MWSMVRHYAAAVSALTLFLTPLAGAAPITFNTALPVSEDEVIFRQQVITTSSSGALSDVFEIRSVSVLGYGVTPKLAVFGALPVVYRDTEDGPMAGSVFGLGDAALFVRYEIFRRDGPGRTVRIAPFTGLNIPTGKRRRTGDGSTDIFGGLILTAATTKWVFDSQIRYTANTEALGFKRGDTASADASVQYRLAAGETGFLFAVLEANVTHLRKDRQFGAENPNSGGVQVFLSPGVQFAAKRWIAEAAVRMPVINDLNGTAPEPDYSVIASLRLNF